MAQKFHNGGRTYAVGKGETDAEFAARLAHARERDRLAGMSRDALIAECAANDRNGCWTDEECEAEGMPPATADDLRSIMIRWFDDNYTGHVCAHEPAHVDGKATFCRVCGESLA